MPSEKRPSRCAFVHVAYEAYADLLTELSALTPLLLAEDAQRLASAYIEIERESFARGSVPHPVTDEERFELEARLRRIGADDKVIPELVPWREFCGFVRRSKRLEQLIELGAPAMIVEDFRDKLRDEELSARNFIAPIEVDWSRPSAFVADAVRVAAVTFDDIGIGDAVNDLPEAVAFFERYPGAYDFWDIHRQVDDSEELVTPEPKLRPSPLWLASAITLPGFFADFDGAPVSHDLDGPVTFGTSGNSLHPALRAACAHAAERGLLVVGYIAVSP